jgi:hypothetical protein
MADSVNIFIGNSVLLSGGNILTTGALTTDAIQEGIANLYHTDLRVTNNVTVQQSVSDITSINTAQGVQDGLIGDNAGNITAIQSQQTSQDGLIGTNAGNISSINTDLSTNYVLKSLSIIDVNVLAYTTGQWVFGSKAGINGGLDFIGICTTFPPTTDSHITFIYREA